jgi:hypothetical protein
MVIDEPMATSIYVLNPAGELRRSRSSPSRPPTTTASSILTATDKKLIFLVALWRFSYTFMLVPGVETLAETMAFRNPGDCSALVQNLHLHLVGNGFIRSAFLIAL